MYFLCSQKTNEKCRKENAPAFNVSGLMPLNENVVSRKVSTGVRKIASGRDEDERLMEKYQYQVRSGNSEAIPHKTAESPIGICEV